MENEKFFEILKVFHFTTHFPASFNNSQLVSFVQIKLPICVLYISFQLLCSKCLSKNTFRIELAAASPECSLRWKMIIDPRPHHVVGMSFHSLTIGNFDGLPVEVGLRFQEWRSCQMKTCTPAFYSFKACDLLRLNVHLTLFINPDYQKCCLHTTDQRVSDTKHE